MHKITVDFNEIVGKIKPVHSMCCAPYAVSMGPEQKLIEKFFKAGNIPFCRLHDCCGAYGGTYFVDVPNIFRDFDADENNPASYDFHYTDEYITAIQKTGCETYYRLGTTIEWGSKKYSSVPPCDFAKWARICEHIVMHYNEGWANGFHYDITYWEIWNEPENPGNEFGKSQWTGTKEEFYELYNVTSKYLKERFSKIKVGGYGSCGFYTLTRTNIPESYSEFIPFFTDFLEYVTKNDCPLDFYSWHIYTSDIAELTAHAKYARETLDKYGFKNTEAHLNEWNIGVEGESFLLKHSATGAAFVAAVMCLLQNTSYVDIAMYYCFSYAGKYNGLLDQNDGSVCPPWYSFEAFGELYALGNAVKTETAGGIYATAAKSDEACAILVSNYADSDNEVTVCFSGLKGEKTLSVSFIDSTRSLDKEITCTVPANGELKIKLPESTVALIRIA